MKKIGFDSIEFAYEYYWDASRNPNNSYEIDFHLLEGERKFCENEGFSWNEWKKLHNNY